MISGIGIDIIEVEKIKNAVKKWGDGFLKKVFTRQEIKYCRSRRFPHIHFASRFAAKEAIAKALGTGFWRKGQRWTDCEIIRADDGGTEVRLVNDLKKKLRNRKVIISMSHCDKFAVANAIVYCVKCKV